MCPNCPLILRLRAPPADAGEIPTDNKKKAQ